MRVSIISLLVLLSTSYNYAQWIQTNGPYGVYADQIANSNSNIYLSSQHSIFLSTNYGLNWNRTLSQLPQQLGLGNLFLHGNYVLIGGIDSINGTQGGLYISSDMGSSWNFILQRTPYQGIPSIYMNNNRIFASSDSYTGTDLFLSDNFGQSWDTVRVDSCYMRAFAVNGNSIFTGGAGYNGYGYHMYVSTNNGLNWSKLPNSPFYVSTILINNNRIVINQANSHSIYISSDNGITWNSGGNGFPTDYRITSIAAIGNNLYASTYVINYFQGGVFKSTDMGYNWSQSGLQYLHINSLGASGNNLYAAAYNGVHISIDGGITWSISNLNLPYLYTNEMCYTGSRIITSSSGAGLFYSSNQGSNWISIDYPIGGVLSISNFGSRVALTNYKVAYYSLDNGDNWNVLVSVPGGVPRISSVDATNNSFLFCQYQTINPNNGSIGVTTDNGATWSYSSQPTVRNFANSGFNIFAASVGGVLMSTNGGFNWININSGIITADIQCIAASNNLVVAGTNGAGPFLSTNNGTSWTPINSGISTSSVFSVIIKGNTIFAGLNSPARNKIFYSTDWGASWLHLDDNLAGYTIIALAADSSYLYASTGTQAGVWRRPFAQITGIPPSSNNVPDRFSLYQNYPNPFNPSTKISYDLPSAVNVKLVVYDMLGREMKTLVNEKQNPGRHEIEFDPSNYPSGVYYYKLSTDNFSETKKMVLIK